MSLVSHMTDVMICVLPCGSWLRRQQQERPSSSTDNHITDVPVFCDLRLDWMTQYSVLGGGGNDDDNVDDDDRSTNDNATRASSYSTWSLTLLAFNTDGILCALERDLDVARACQRVVELWEDL